MKPFRKSQVLFLFVMALASCNSFQNPVIKYWDIISRESKVTYSAHITAYGNTYNDTVDITARYYIEELPDDTFFGARVIISDKYANRIYDSSALMYLAKYSSYVERIALLKYPSGVYYISGHFVSSGILNDFIADSVDVWGANTIGHSESTINGDTATMFYWTEDTVEKVERVIKYYFLMGEKFPSKIERKDVVDKTDTVYMTIEFSDVKYSFNFDKEKKKVLKGKKIVDKIIEEKTADDYRLKFSVLPEISGEDVVKGIRTTTAKTDKEYRLIDFWYMSCPPCKAAIPHLVEMQKKYADKLQVIGVDFIDMPSLKPNIVQYAKAVGLNYPFILTDRDSLQSLGVSVFPTLVLTDKNGRILFQEIGWSGDATIDSVAKYIAK